MGILFDGLTPLERLQLTQQGIKLINQLKSMGDGGSPIARLKTIKDMLVVKAKLEEKDAEAPVVNPHSAEPHQIIEENRPKKSITVRQRHNDAAIALLRQIQTGEVSKPLSKEQKEVLSQYSGSGGGLKAADGSAGSPYEYYTPKPIAGAMWDVLQGLGFGGGKVLDPSAGMGVFAQTKPKSVAIDQVELDSVSGEINGLINDDPTVSVKVSPYEVVAASSEDEQYDAIVTNVPFGEHAMRGSTYKLDQKYQKADMQTYFILRTLDKLKFGGFAAFIVPSSVVSGKGGKAQKLRVSISMQAELVGAYRLPNQVFDEAGADVITDVIVLRKHGRDQTDKINELRQQNAGVLSEANVLWAEFIDGNYFKGEGKKYQIGESTVGMGKFGEVEKVVHDGDIASVAKLMRPFDKTSRIDWAMMDAVETMPITYKEGDTVYLNGALLQMQGGELKVVESGIQNADGEAEALKDQMKTPFDVINNDLTFDDAQRVINNETREGRIDDLPMWIRQAVKYGKGDSGFKAIIAGLCVHELNDASGVNDGTKYTELYPKLSAVIMASKRTAVELRKTAPSNIADALDSIQKAANKSGFTSWWRGELAAQPDVIVTPHKAYEKAKYELSEGEGYVSVDIIKQSVPSFDPINDESDSWCISPDGKGVISPSDYYYGSYAEFLERAKMELAAADDPAVKEQLIRQHQKAKTLVQVVSISDMSFDMHTPFVSIDEKLEYLQQYVDGDYGIKVNDEGVRSIEYKGKPARYESAAAERERKLKSRLAFYMNNGTIRTGTKKDDIVTQEQIEAEEEFQAQLSSFVGKTNSSFDAWVKANESIRNQINDRLNAPENLRFTEIMDYTPIDIDGWKPERKPHGYQSAAVRRFTKRFSGIMGHDVGLGKTLAALATVQYAHSVGAKNRTIFAIPNQVFSNWKKEAEMSLTDTSDCLYVGFVKKGDKYKYDSGAVADDLNKITSGKFRKIFMTYEALVSIPMRDETLEAYADYIAANDNAYAAGLKSGKKEDAIKAESAKAKLSTGSKRGKASVAYFEDMKIDSIVIDEAHAFKNSKFVSNADEGGFAPTKYVPVSTISDRGVDIQQKCWYIRHSSAAGDGVMAMTATPLTNSPLEIYSMLSLSIGEQDVNRIMGSSNANGFMNAICDVRDETYRTITDDPKTDRALGGLKNLNLLRRLMNEACSIETVDSVAEKGIYIEVPESEEQTTSVALPAGAVAQLMELKKQYKEVNQAKKNGESVPSGMAVLASPFNLIRQMSKLIVDEELFNGKFEFTFEKDDDEAAKKAVEAFNSKKVTEQRKEHELPSDVELSALKSKEILDPETGGSIIVYDYPIKAVIKGNKITLPAVTYKAQEVLVAQLDKFKVTPIFADASPKISALLANVRDENASPRWKPPKQIVFCDELGLHFKLRFMISNETGIPLSKIQIVNAQSVTPENIQDVQDGYNADGDDDSETPNRTQIIIANKKAEVGINLQKGTQAIHHLTIGWTPDSIHQRNGRGVRQGNKISTPINIYHYEADGTFDSYKRHLVSVKADWISSVMDENAKTIGIQGDLSKEDYESMVDAVGDSEAMARIQANATKKAQERIIQANKSAQINSVANIVAAKKWLDRYGESPNKWCLNKHQAIRAAQTQRKALQLKLDKTESEMMAKRHKVKIQELDAKIAELEAELDGVDVHEGFSQAYVVLKSDYDESATKKNWEKDVAINKKMLDESRNAFLLRDNMGYSKDALDAVESDRAVVVGSRIIMEGDVVEVRAGFGLVRKAGIAYDRSSYAEAEIQLEDGTADFNLITTPIIRHESRDTEGYKNIIAEIAAACDKYALTEGGKRGKNGLWNYCTDIADAMTVSVPSSDFSYGRLGDVPTIGFKSPLFPVLISSENEGDFVGFEGEIKSQRELLLTTHQNNYSDGVYFKDAKSAKTIQKPVDAVKAWLLANNKRIPVNSDFNTYKYLHDADSIERARAVAAGKAQTIKEYSEIILSEFMGNNPCVSCESADILAKIASSEIQKEINKDLIALDDGSDPVLTSVFIGQYMVSKVDPAPFILKHLRDNDLIVSVDELLNQYSTEERNRFFAIAVGGKLSQDGKVELYGEYADIVRANSNMRASLIPVLDDRSVLNAISNSSALRRGLAEMKAKKALSGTGLNIEDVIKVLSEIEGVEKAEVGSANIVKTSNKWSGALLLSGGTYVKLFTSFYSRLKEKIAAKNQGLEGRYWHNDMKCWILPLQPVQYSDGKDAATVKDLLVFIGEKSKADQLFGGN